MRENLAHKPVFEELSKEETSANESTFDTELKLVPKETALTPVESEEMITLEQSLAALPNEHDLPEGFPSLRTADLIEIIADDAFVAPPPPRLTRADFTKEAIEAARGINLPTTAKNELPTQYPEYQKIEPAQRVNERKQSETSVTHMDPYPPVTHDNRLTRANFPGQGSATMPNLVFKKPLPVARNSFFKRLMPSFLKRIFK